MKFLLLTTQKKNFVKVWVCQQTSIAASIVPPIDLVSIATVLKKNGHRAKILDLRLYKNPFLKLKHVLKQYKPDFLVTNLTTPSAFYDYRMLSIADKKIKKIVFGTHAIAFPQEVFDNGIDFILYGDPEKAILNLLASKSGNKNIEGVWTSQKKSAKAATFNNLDDLPFLDLSFLDLKKYSTAYFNSGEKSTFLLSARGCSYGCTFCQHPILFGKRYRQQSVKRMVDELQYLKKKFNIREVFYLDGTFNISAKKVTDFCDEILLKKLKINWSINARVEPTPFNLLQKMKKSGCKRLMFGVEDFDLLEGIKKRITKKEIIDAFKRVKKAKLKADAYLMIFPETKWGEKTYLKHLIKMVKEINPDAFQCNIAIPLPGTAFFEKFDKKNNLSKNWTLYDPSATYKLPYFCQNDLLAIRRKFYFLYPLIFPAKAFKILINTSPDKILNLFKNYLSFLKPKKNENIQ